MSWKTGRVFNGFSCSLRPECYLRFGDPERASGLDAAHDRARATARAAAADSGRCRDRDFRRFRTRWPQAMAQPNIDRSISRQRFAPPGFLRPHSWKKGATSARTTEPTRRWPRAGRVAAVEIAPDRRPGGRLPPRRAPLHMLGGERVERRAGSGKAKGYAAALLAGGECSAAGKPSSVSSSSATGAGSCARSTSTAPSAPSTPATKPKSGASANKPAPPLRPPPDGKPSFGLWNCPTEGVINEPIRENSCRCRSPRHPLRRTSTARAKACPRRAAERPSPEATPIRPRITSRFRLVSSWGRVSVQTK